jgi:hypothetical protein
VDSLRFIACSLPFREGIALHIGQSTGQEQIIPETKNHPLSGLPNRTGVNMCLHRFGTRVAM